MEVTSVFQGPCASAEKTGSAADLLPPPAQGARLTESWPGTRLVLICKSNLHDGLQELVKMSAPWTLGRAAVREYRAPLSRPQWD